MHPVGSCMMKCPQKEGKMRTDNGLVHWMEEKCVLIGGRQRRVPDLSKLVKEYRRPAADKYISEDELRPPPVLVNTVNYLIDEVVTRTDCSWARVYEFVFDRLRAVRQDMVVQRLQGECAITLLEKIVRFHVCAGYRLCGEGLNQFDPQINDSHTLECLKRLHMLYESTTGKQAQENRAEFLALYLLFNLGQQDALPLYFSSDKSLRSHPLVANAHAIHTAANAGNFVRVFKISRKLPVLMLCALHRHTVRLHRDALVVMSAGFHSKNLKFPLHLLSVWLGGDGVDWARNLCLAHNLKPEGDHVVFQKGAVDASKLMANARSQLTDQRLSSVSINRLLHGS